MLYSAPIIVNSEKQSASWIRRLLRGSSLGQPLSILSASPCASNKLSGITGCRLSMRSNYIKWASTCVQRTYPASWQRTFSPAIYSSVYSSSSSNKTNSSPPSGGSASNVPTLVYPDMSTLDRRRAQRTLERFKYNRPFSTPRQIFASAVGEGVCVGVGLLDTP